MSQRNNDRPGVQGSQTGRARYQPQEIEPKWQRFWLEHKTFRAEDDYTQPKFYILDMFPYPSAAGLHIGHPEGFTPTEITTRYIRMSGFKAIHPTCSVDFCLRAETSATPVCHPPHISTDRYISTSRWPIPAQ